MGDTQHWHNSKDIEERINLFKNINYECLYITDKILRDISDENLINEIRRFIND